MGAWKQMRRRGPDAFFDFRSLQISRKSQPTLWKPTPLTVPFVFNKVTEIAKTSGQNVSRLFSPLPPSSLLISKSALTPSLFLPPSPPHVLSPLFSSLTRSPSPSSLSPRTPALVHHSKDRNHQPTLLRLGRRGSQVPHPKSRRKAEDPIGREECHRSVGERGGAFEEW